MNFDKATFITVFEWFFNLILFTKSALYLPQAYKIYKTKQVRDVSLLTFGWLMLVHISMVIHGLIHSDYALAIGYALSGITCGSVVVLSIYYRGRSSNKY